MSDLLSKTADDVLGIESLVGTIRRVLFANEETGYQVMKVKVDDQKDPVSVAGCSHAKEGEQIRAKGAWVVHPSFGPQFKAESIVAVLPTTREGLIAFLSSGLIKGIGKTYATRIVDHFGFDTIEVLDAEPARVIDVSGIGAARANKIAKGWQEQRSVREIMIFLQSNGVTTSQAFRIYKTYGEGAVDKIRSNPYRLARDVRGIGFSGADKIAANLGIPRDSIQRVKAGIQHALYQNMSQGHCGMERSDLLENSNELLGVSGELLELALAEELNAVDSTMEQDGGKVYISYLAARERFVAKRFADLIRGDAPWPAIEVMPAIDAVERQIGFTLAPAQKDAVALGIRSKVAVITGGPGVGKTTILNAILKILMSQGVRVALAAPTGKAAKRMQESTGRVAETIHRLIGLGGTGRKSLKPIECDLLVVDESSMLDISLIASLLEALPNRAALLIVGDVDQLPSVGPGQVLADLIESGIIPVARLNKIFRQAEGSLIIDNAHRINAGELPQHERGSKSDFYFIEANKPERVISTIKTLVTGRIKRAFGLASDQIQILSPMNRSETGNFAMNTLMQSLINPNPARKITKYGRTLGVGDRVMQVLNNYDKAVFNGDMGVVTAIDEENDQVVVDIDGRQIEYESKELDELVLAYAMTIHKSQGSEFPCVIIPVTTQHFMMLARNLIYTGVTRGRKLVILVGQTKALAMAVQNDRSMQRVTRLKRFLQEEAA